MPPVGIKDIGAGIVSTMRFPAAVPTGHDSNRVLIAMVGFCGFMNVRERGFVYPCAYPRVCA